MPRGKITSRPTHTEIVSTHTETSPSATWPPNIPTELPAIEPESPR